eukprot:4861108-Amphidinium_carterae.5
MQSQPPRVLEGREVRELVQGSVQGVPSEDDEEDDFDEYDTSHQSGATTRATESLTRKIFDDARTWKITTTTCSYHAQITTFHAAPPPMMTRPTNNAAAGEVFKT